MPAYYSGDLAAINAGRTADAAVEAQSQAAFQRYLADLATNRTRRELGQGDLALRSSLGNRQLSLDESALGVRDRLGTRGLAVEEENAALRRMLGMRNADLRRDELGLAREVQTSNSDLNQWRVALDAVRDENAYDLGKRQINLYGSGIGQDYRAIDLAARRRAEEEDRIAQSDIAAQIANALLPKARKTTPPVNTMFWHGKDYEQNADWDLSPEYRSTVVGSVLQQLDPELAPLVRLDPLTGRFVPRFGAQQQAAPGATTPVATPVPGVPLVTPPRVPSFEGLQLYRSQRR